MNRFTRKTPAEKSGLDSAIDEVLQEMKNFHSDDDEYAKMVKQLKKLYALKEVDKPPRINPDTLAIIAGNIVVTLMIVGHERANVIASKARGFLLNIR